MDRDLARRIRDRWERMWAATNKSNGSLKALWEKALSQIQAQDYGVDSQVYIRDGRIFRFTLDNDWLELYFKSAVDGGLFMKQIRPPELWDFLRKCPAVQEYTVLCAMIPEEDIRE